MIGALAAAALLLPVGAPAPARAEGAASPPAAPLTGRVVVLDAGHQLGNANFPTEINRLVSAGPSKKPCNTTGTATNGGFPEATFVWRVTRRVKSALQAQGASVVMVRTSNRSDRWGPCVDVRGRAGNRIRADLKVSIHADGSYVAGARGFHVIAPGRLPGWNDDIQRPSRRLAVAIKGALVGQGLPCANYLAGGDGVDFRTDLATLNLSNLPTVMVELGNMRNTAEAARMTSKRGQRRYARALTAGITHYLR